MLTERDGVQLKLHSITIEDLVPENHFLRKLETVVDFSFIYDEVRELYCPDNGRPSIDPVMLVKYLLVGYLYGIESERRIEQEIQVNMAYRWFLGVDLDERVPDHSTISQNRRRRFNGENLFRSLFEHILRQCIEKGLVDGRIILTDSTHVKANASSKAKAKAMVERETADYVRRLDEYEVAERERLEAAGAIKPQREPRRGKTPELVERTVSSTDPDAGMLRRPGKPEGMHYLDHESVDAKNGIIVDVAVTPGNSGDSEPYLGRMEYIREHLGLDVEIAGADSAYGTSLICQAMEDMGIRLYTPGTTTGGATYKVKLTRDDFEYNAEKDCFICPMGKELPLRSLERERHNICRVYRASRKDCRSCPMLKDCVAGSQSSRSLRVNIFEEAVKRQRQNDGAPERKRILDLRQIWCEGTFAAQKWMHNLRRLFRRGLEAAEDHCLLSAMALNMKRMVKCLG
jgi:transposase